jgi:hypothetical protein
MDRGDEFGMRNAEIGMRNVEWGSRKAEGEPAVFPLAAGRGRAKHVDLNIRKLFDYNFLLP